MASLYQGDFTQDSEEVPEMHCEQCIEFGESAVAEGFCVNCFEYMCKSCLKYHARQNQQHIIQDRKTMPQDFCFEQCSVHTSKFIRFYCSVCEKSACCKCRANDHKNCNFIGHVPTIAKEVENSKELEELYKDINLISSELRRTKDVLTTCMQKVDLQKKQDLRAIEKKKEDRKLESAKLQKKLTDKFDRFKTDMITVINKIQVENTSWLTMELNMIDIEQTGKEDQTLASLEKATTTDMSNKRSLLATNTTLNGGIQTVLADLTQKQNAEQRCKLFLALKAAVPYTKMQKQKMQELAAAVQLASSLPQLKKQHAMDSDYEAIDTQTLSDLPEELDEERIRDLFRTARKLKCSNTMCGTSGYGKFCQECGHRMVVTVICKVAEQVLNQYEEDEEVDNNVRPTQILVSNLPSSTNSDFLEMFFENSRRFGQYCVVNHVDFDKEKLTAVVEFEEPEAVGNVLAKGPLNIMGQEVEMRVYKPKQQTRKPEPNRTIKVNGVDKRMSKDALELYFENHGRSGGGLIERSKRDKDVLYITFKNSDDAKQVASRDHKLNGRYLGVSMFGFDYYKNKVLIKGLHSSTTDILFNYIESKTGLIPETIEYHAGLQGVAIITFYDNSAVTFSAFEKIRKIRKFCGASLEVYPVPIPNCIIVANLSDTVTKDNVEFYFENTRKSGGGVNDVEMIDDHTCLVLFYDVSVIESVLNRSHILHGQRLDVKLYHGLERPGQIYKNDKESYSFKDQ